MKHMIFSCDNRFGVIDGITQIRDGYLLRVSALTDYAEIVLDCFEKCNEIPVYGTDEPLTVRNAVRYPAVKLSEHADKLERQINGGTLTAALRNDA